MSDGLFFRLLEVSVEAKGEALAKAVRQISERAAAEATMYLADAQTLRQIPGSPFAYWASDTILAKFSEFSPLSAFFTPRVGLQTSNDVRFLRCWWEVSAASIHNHWYGFAKGGQYSPYYYDTHLVINWKDNGRELKAWADPLYGNSGWSRIIKSVDFYFRPGLTWPRRTQRGLNLRALPAGCIFADKGPSIFVADEDENALLRLLGITNSQFFSYLVELQMAFGSYEVGVIQRTSVPEELSAIDTSLVHQAHDLTRDADRTDETTHAFGLPGLADRRAQSLPAVDGRLTEEHQDRLRRLCEIQYELDEQVFSLYDLSESDREWVRAEASHPHPESVGPEDEDDEDDEDAGSGSEDLPLRVQNLLMWCMGVAFGRWDIRFALEPDLLSALQGPFDPLPRVAPGGLVGPNGLPATRDNIASEAWLVARENVLHIPDLPLPEGAPTTIPAADYPLPVAWDGILVDDLTHPSDIVGRVRGVLALLWGDRAAAIEQEACDILGVNGLRDYFRDPRNGFFAFHIKRYSKSRRKAPIYWLLQSANRNYAIWLYIHRMDDQTYFTAARDYADTKVNLEAARLDELREGLPALSGSAQKRREREIEQQEKLVDEVTTFRNTLDKIALLGLPPDLNDGVVLGIAPLHELVPWKEADKYWHALLDGEYEWSTMAQRMRERGLVK